MFTSLKRLAIAGLFLLPLGAASLAAQATPGDTVVTSPTAEGSVIKNVASASYTDVNNNTYTAVKDSVSVTVGFLAAPNPTGQASYSPLSPSSGNVAAFTITNSGNGVDSMTVDAVAGTGLTITKYTYNGVDYATAAALNAVIRLVSLPSGASLPFPVNVVYSVSGNSGGVSRLITLTQTSVRVPAESADWRTSILPPVFDSVTVSPDGATVAKVISNGAADYTYTFTVTNRGNRNNTFSVSSLVVGGAVNGTVVITGTSPSSTAALIPGASATITVSYRVLDGTAPDKIQLTASGTGASDTGDVTVSESKANLTLTKTAWTAMTAGTLIANNAASAITPGTTFYYKLAITNVAGSADASSVVLTDVLSSALTFVSATGDTPADWAIVPSTVLGVTTVTATLSPVVPAGTTRYIWIGAKIATVATPPTP